MPLYPSAVGPRHLCGGRVSSRVRASGMGQRARAPLGVLSARAAVWLWQMRTWEAGALFGSMKGKLGNPP